MFSGMGGYRCPICPRKSNPNIAISAKWDDICMDHNESPKVGTENFNVPGELDLISKSFIAGWIVVKYWKAVVIVVLGYLSISFVFATGRKFMYVLKLRIAIRQNGISSLLRIIASDIAKGLCNLQGHAQSLTNYKPPCQCVSHETNQRDVGFS